MTKPITGKVARVITEHHLALNIGSDHGVVKGMRFSVYSPDTPVFDPDTHEELGRVSFEKGKVEIYEVFEKYCLAQTYELEKVLPYPTLFMPSVKKLPVDASDLVEFEARVKAGDSVKQIIEGEE
jgi:hypothetical protein